MSSKTAPDASFYTPADSFVPGDVSAVSAWLRVASATSDGNGISSVPDAMNTNPAVQSVTARKPVVENSANGLPCMRFATNDVLAWPITAQSSASEYAGWGFWVKFAAIDIITQYLVSAVTGTGAASTNKLKLDWSATSSGGFRGAYYTPAAGVKRGPTGAPDTGWRFVTIEFDSSGASEEARRTLTLDGVSVGSATGTGTTLATATGNILIGNGADDATGIFPLNGLLGPNIYAFGSKMPGAEFGLLTTAARTALKNFEAPA